MSSHGMRAIAPVTLGMLLLFLVAAGGAAWRPGLHSLDDCFYARKAVEMQRSTSLFTVSWNGQPTWQNPPLQLACVALAFRIFGVSDPVARLPQLVMAAALLPLTGWIALRLGLSRRAAVLALAVLATTPLLLANAVRVMMDIPATFWCCATIAAALFLRETRARGCGSLRVWVGCALLTCSIAGAMLTKSLLGLTGVAILGVSAALRVRVGVRDGAGVPVEELRGPDGGHSTRHALSGERGLAPRLGYLPELVAVAAGILLGSSWYLHQFAVFGMEALEAHFGTEILARTLGPKPWLDRLRAYPEALLLRFQPWIIPSLIAVAGIARTPGLRRGPLALVAVWILLPPVAFTLSSTQRESYLYPILPAMAIATAWGLERRWPAPARILGGWVLPCVLALLGAIRIVAPQWLGRQHNRAMIATAPLLQRAVPEGHAVPSFRVSYWRVANPMLYYADRFLERPLEEPGEVLRRARLGDGMLVSGPEGLSKLLERAPEARELARDRYWVLLQLPQLAPGAVEGGSQFE